MKTPGIKTATILSAFFMLVITCFANSAWSDSNPYYSMSPKKSYVPVVLAFGVCNMVNGTEATNTVTYSYVNGTSINKAFSAQSKDAASPATTYYVKPGTWKVELENSCIKQTLNTYINISNGTWKYAKGCNQTSTTADCDAGHLMPPLPASNQPGGPNLTPGCQQNHFTPPPPPPMVCGDNTNTTGWDDDRITITNNCADDAYIVITPPTADKPWKQYNLKLWEMAAKQAGMTDMYANPNDLSSALMFRRKLASGQSMKIPVPEGGIASGNIGVLLNCQQDPTGIGWPGNCTIGAVPGTASTGVGTILEYSAGCTYTTDEDRKTKCTINPSSNLQYCMGGADYYDISMVNGFSIPMNATVRNSTDYKCNVTEINGVTDLFDCPTENSTTISATGSYVKPYNNPQLAQGINLNISNNATVKGRAACITPAQWLNAGGQNPKNTQTVALGKDPVELNELSIADWYACNGIPSGQDSGNPSTCTGPGCGGPQCAIGPDGVLSTYNTANLIAGKGIPYTNYVKYLKAIGVDGYAWQFNDDASTLLCNKAGAPVHLTLCPGHKGQKPYKKQKWVFENNRCNALPPDGDGKYDTLLACMKDNYWYTCQQEEVKKFGPDNTVVSADLNYCKPYKAKTDSSALSSGVPLQTYEQCMQHEAQCQKFGPETP